MMMRTFWLLISVPAVFGLTAFWDRTANAADVSINWCDVKQTIKGFGASSTFFGDTISASVADQLFDAKKGIGLSLLRIQIGLPADTQGDGSEPSTGARPVASSPEFNTAKQAYARGCQIWATAWTPPPIWKTTNNKNGSGSGYSSNKLKPENYQDYTNYLADFVDLMKKGGVPISALSPANEPDYVATWDNAQWSGDELTTFVAQNLGPTFASRCPTVKIVVPDTANWSNCDGYVTPLLTDAAAKGYVGIIATHPYGISASDLTYDKPRQNGKDFWQTEWSQENMNGDTPDPSMNSAIDMVQNMHKHLTVTQMNAWSWWAIYITYDALASADPNRVRQNPALMQATSSGTDPYMFKRGYALGNWSKFVRPGFQRLGTTEPSPTVFVEAYRDASHIAIIAVNTDTSSVTQKFILNGADLSSLTPWVTSADDSLAPGTPVSVSTADDGFTYELPGQSVVTFVNWDATTETPDPLTNTGRSPDMDAATNTCPSGTGGESGTGGTTASSGGATDVGGAAGTGGLANSGGTNASADAGGGGCDCRIGRTRRAGALWMFALLVATSRFRRRRARPRIYGRKKTLLMMDPPRQAQHQGDLNRTRW